jgi:predicted RNase H-like HicB family nuclease
MRNYAAVIHKDKDTAYGVHFPDLVGCFAGGDTEEEALDSARLSLRIYTDDLIETGRSLPRARTVQELEADEDVRQSIAEGGMLVLISQSLTSQRRSGT